MQVSQRLDIQADEFFNYIVNQMKQDIKMTNKVEVLSLEELDGFNYIRKLKKQKSGDVFQVHIHVGPIIKNKYYEVSYVTPTAKSRYFYDIRDNGEYIIVTYAEEGEAEGKLNNWFHKIQVKIREKQISNQISLTLRNIEQEIKKNK